MKGTTLLKHSIKMDCVDDVDGMKFEWRMYNFPMVAEVLRMDVRGGYCYNTWVGLQIFFFIYIYIESGV